MNVYILLDRSGSMEGQWVEALGSINGYAKKLPKATKVHLAAFDSVAHEVLRDVKASDWKDVTPEEVMPRGGTPLYDSCARVMSLAEAENSPKTILVVMTDGEENASKEVRRETVIERVAAWTAKNWDVTFLGANFDRVDRVSSSVGVRGGRSMSLTAGHYMKSMSNLADSAVVYGASVNATMADFSDEERAVAAGKA